MNKSKTILQPVNYVLLTIVLALTFFGLAALGSASQVISWNHHGNTHYYLLHQLFNGLIPGLIIMVILSRIHYRVWQKFAVPILFIGVAFLIAVLIPEFGVRISGAQRWLNLGFITFQPAEFIKLALVIYLAAWFAKRKSVAKENFSNALLPAILICAVILFLVYLQPDVGTLIILCLIAGTLFFVAGSKLKYLAGLGGALVLALFLAVKAAPYRAARLVTFLDPSHDPLGIGYHVNQALLAVGSGGILGYGYNNSLQKYNYLPEPMGDSVFAIIAEEMGFIRTALLLALFAAFAYVGLNIARNADSLFGRYLAVGIVAWISFQAFINIGAMLALMPLTGITLPFISYGATATIIAFAAVGILLNISRYSNNI